MIKLLVECPHCGWRQATRTIKRVKCFRCGKSFQVYYKSKPSRIVRILEGSLAELHRLYYYVYKKDKHG